MTHVAARARSRLAGVAAFLAAFAAGSHHSLHMLLISVGLGGSSILFSPALRRAMLAVSLGMGALSLWWLLRKERPGEMETLAVFAALGSTLVILAWTVMKHGW